MNRVKLYRVGRLAMLCLFMAMFPGIAAMSQEFRGTISGIVTDPSGAVVPGATVVVRETRTGTVNQTKSGNDGQYVVPFLLPGDYSDFGDDARLPEDGAKRHHAANPGTSDRECNAGSRRSVADGDRYDGCSTTGPGERFGRFSHLDEVGRGPATQRTYAGCIDRAVGRCHFDGAAADGPSFR